jgi:hypothetical protein
MTTMREGCNAYAPAYRQRYPHLPRSQQKAISAIQNWKTGHSGHSLDHGQNGGKHPPRNHACGHRHGPPCQHHTPQLWVPTQREKQLPGPHVLSTFPVPETLRPLLRAPPQSAYQALCKASSAARKRLAKAERFLGIHLPGFPGVLHPWGRQLPDHPPSYDIVPGGGLSTDRTAWLSSSDHGLVPVRALSPSYRAGCKDTRRQAGLLEHLAPHVWTIPWNVHSQAQPDAHAALTSLAPSVFRGAIANHRLVSRQDRTVTLTSRQPGSTRLRTTRLEVIECLRRVLQHVLPAGCQQVRPVGFLRAGWTLRCATLRRTIAATQLVAARLPRPPAPPPPVAPSPRGGHPMPRVLRQWTADHAFVETGGEQL